MQIIENCNKRLWFNSGLNEIFTRVWDLIVIFVLCYKIAKWGNYCCISFNWQFCVISYWIDKTSFLSLICLKITLNLLRFGFELIWSPRVQGKYVFLVGKDLRITIICFGLNMAWKRSSKSMEIGRNGVTLQIVLHALQFSNFILFFKIKN